MGICASSHLTMKGGRMNNCSSTAKVIHIDGKLQEFRQPIKASHVLSLNPNTFLCNSDTMYVNSPVPHVAADEELHLGQIYFLMPTSKLQKPLSLQDLGTLTIKASTAMKMTQFSDENNVSFRLNHHKVKGGVGYQQI